MYLFARNGSDGQACVELGVNFIGFDVDYQHYADRPDRLLRKLRLTVTIPQPGPTVHLQAVWRCDVRSSLAFPLPYRLPFWAA